MAGKLPEYYEEADARSSFVEPNVANHEDTTALIKAIVDKANEGLPKEGGPDKPGLRNKITVGPSNVAVLKLKDGRLKLVPPGEWVPGSDNEWYENNTNISLDRHLRFANQLYIIKVPAGHLMKAKFKGKDILLTAGRHVYNTNRFSCDYKSMEAESAEKSADKKTLFPLESEVINHGSITRINVQANTVGVVSVKGVIKLLKPGVYVRDLEEGHDPIKYLGALRLDDHELPVYKDDGYTCSVKSNQDHNVFFKVTVKYTITEKNAPTVVKQLYTPGEEKSIAAKLQSLVVDTLKPLVAEVDTDKDFKDAKVDKAAVFQKKIEASKAALFAQFERDYGITFTEIKIDEVNIHVKKAVEEKKPDAAALGDKAAIDKETDPVLKASKTKAQAEIIEAEGHAKAMAIRMETEQKWLEMQEKTFATRFKILEAASKLAAGDNDRFRVCIEYLSNTPSSTTAGDSPHSSFSSKSGLGAAASGEKAPAAKDKDAASAATVKK